MYVTPAELTIRRAPICPACDPDGLSIYDDLDASGIGEPDTRYLFPARPDLAPARARPFLKWAGGKRAIVPAIARHLPSTIETYWEPFLGGGAVFFGLDAQFPTAALSDVNAELTLTYQVVRNELDSLIASLRKHEARHSSRHYLRVREAGEASDAVDIAARFIYLNKTCFNGLYRVNKAGRFNVPMGAYKNPAICDSEGLQAASEVLQKATIRFGDFETTDPSSGDFVYADPPYDQTFTGYDRNGFGQAEQRRLRDAALEWHEHGAAVMLSNSDTPLIRDLYGQYPFRLHEVRAPRAINSDGNGRGAVVELLITTYG